MHKKLVALDRDGGGRGWLARRVRHRWCGERKCTYEVRFERGRSAAARCASTSRTPTSSSSTRRWLRHGSVGRCSMRSTQPAAIPGQAGPEGMRLVPEVAAGFPRRLEGRQDLHVHDPQGAQVQRRQDRLDRTCVHAGARAAADPKQAVAGDRVLHDVVGADARNDRQGQLGRRRHGQGPDADDQARSAPPVVPRASSRCRSSALSSRTWPIDPKGVNVFPSAGPY